MKTPDVSDASAAAALGETDASTRGRVLRSILQHGPSTASELAVRLDITPAAVRRHLGVLEEVGQVEPRERRVYGSRGRGRPAHAYVLTDTGRSQFYAAYDELAIAALGHLRSTAGEEAVEGFAESVAARVQRRFDQLRPEHSDALEALVAALNDNGFVTSLRPIPSGQQLCQYHCPVAHVAEAFPELCAAETRAFARILDSHVQRLATIAHGDGVCTTHVPRPVAPADHTSTRKVS